MKIEFGKDRICPRCKGRGTEPKKPKQQCLLCGGTTVIRKKEE